MYGELISSVTVGAGGASSIDFTSIPGTYTDLCLVVSGVGLYSSIKISFNGVTTGSQYSYRYLQGTGSYPDTYGTTANTLDSALQVYGNPDLLNSQIYIPNYAGSNHKTISVNSVSEYNATGAMQTLYAGRWSDTSAISSIKLAPGSGTFAQYSTAYLYGLTKGSGGATVS